MANAQEPGGALPPLGDLFNESFQDFGQNIGGYLLATLGVMLVAFPVTMVLTMVGMVVMYAVIILGIVGSAVGGAALGEASQDAAGLMAVFGSFGSMFAGFFVMALFVSLGVGLTAPLNASLERAIAAHQRGEAPLEFNAAFKTMGEGFMSAVTAQLLVTGASLLGVFFCYVGALVPLVLFSFVMPMVALHRKGAFEALSRCARHAMAHPSEHLTFGLVYFGMTLVASYVPIVGPAFMRGLKVRAYRKFFGDGAEPNMGGIPG